MAKQLYPLCSVGRPTMRDGWVGKFAHILLPFYGYWFASGQVYTNSNSTIAQDNSLTIGGTSMHDNFRKEGNCRING